METIEQIRERATAEAREQYPIDPDASEYTRALQSITREGHINGVIAEATRDKATQSVLLQELVDALSFAENKSEPLMKQGEDYIWRPVTAIYAMSRSVLAKAHAQGITPTKE